MGRLNLIAIVILLSLVAGKYILYQSEQITKQKEKITALETTINRIVSFEEGTAVIDERINQEIQDLQNKKGRESTIVARPGLVENLINKSFKEQQEAIVCITEGTCEQ